MHLIKDEIKHHRGKALGILSVLVVGHVLLVLWLF